MIGYEFLKHIPEKAYRGSSIYTEEHNLLRELLVSDSEAIRFSYATKRKATTARQVLQTYIGANRMSLRATQRASDVIVFKTKKEQK